MPITRRSRTVTLVAIWFLLALGFAVTGSAQAGAANPLGLGTATSFAILAGSTVTNTGPSTIGGDLGVSPGTAITGFPPGTVTGTIHSADALAESAQADATTAYNAAAAQATTATITADLGGQALDPGVYTGTTLSITGTLTLDAHGDPNALFVFQSAKTLITASESTVSLINGANPCNVYWQLGSSATLGTNSVFVGTVLAQASVSATTGAMVDGRLIARNGAVTLDSNTVTAPNCAPPPTTTTTAATTTSSTVVITPPTLPTTAPATTTSSTVVITPPTLPTTTTTTPGSTTTTAPNSTHTRTSTTTSTTGRTTTGLARTGTDTGGLLLLGLLAILIGAGLTLASRLTKRSQAE
jgi:hypothetical protein